MVDYAGQIERNNNANEEIVEPVNRFQLLYTMNNKETQSSGIAVLPTNTISPRMNNEKPIFNTHEDNNVFNIQLDYDINQTSDSKS